MGKAYTSDFPFKKGLFQTTDELQCRPFFCTSDQFISNKRSEPNQTPSIFIGSSVQRKGPGRETSFYAPNCNRLIAVELFDSY